MALDDHYQMEDMDKVLEHIRNVINASVDAVKAAETANEDLAKNAKFQIEQSIDAVMAYHRKKLKLDESARLAHIGGSTRRNMF